MDEEWTIGRMWYTQCHKPTIWDGTYMFIPTIYGHVGAWFIVGFARLDKLSGSIAEKNMEKVRSAHYHGGWEAGYRFLALQGCDSVRNI